MPSHFFLLHLRGQMSALSRAGVQDSLPRAISSSVFSSCVIVLFASFWCGLKTNAFLCSFDFIYFYNLFCLNTNYCISFCYDRKTVGPTGLQKGGKLEVEAPLFKEEGYKIAPTSRKVNSKTRE